MRMAAIKNHIEALELLCKQGADVNKAAQVSSAPSFPIFECITRKKEGAFMFVGLLYGGTGIHQFKLIPRIVSYVCSPQGRGNTSSCCSLQG